MGAGSFGEVVRDRTLGGGGVMFSGRLCWWVVVLGDVLAGQGCSLGIVVVVPGNSGNTSGDGLEEGCVLCGRGEFHESFYPP